MAGGSAYRRLRRGLPLAIGFSLLVLAGIVAYASSRRDEDVLEVLSALPWWALPLALMCHVAAHMLWGARMSLLAFVLARPLSARGGWATVTAGTFGGAITPGRLGGEGLKLALLMRRGHTGAQASRLLLVDRAFDLVFFVCLGSVAIILLPRHLGAQGAAAQGLAILGTAFLGLFVILLALALISPRATTRAFGPLIRVAARIGKRDPASWSIRAIGFVEQLRDGLLLVARRRPGLAAAAALLTLGNWLIEYAVLWVLLGGFGHLVPYGLVFASGAVITLVSNVPATPGGTGVAEATAIAILAPLAPGISLLFVVAWRGVTYYYDIVAGGIVAAVLMARRRVRPEDENAVESHSAAAEHAADGAADRGRLRSASPALGPGVAGGDALLTRATA